MRIVPATLSRCRHRHQPAAYVVGGDVVVVVVVVVLVVLDSAAVQTSARAAATPSGGSAAAHYVIDKAHPNPNPYRYRSLSVHSYRWPWTAIDVSASAWVVSSSLQDYRTRRCPRCAPRPHRPRSDTDRSCAPPPHADAATNAAVVVAAAGGGATVAAAGGGAATVDATDAADHRWCRAPCGSNTAVGIYGSNVQLWCWYVVGVASRSGVITQTLTWSGALANCEYGNGNRYR